MSCESLDPLQAALQLIADWVRIHPAIYKFNLHFMVIVSLCMHQSLQVQEVPEIAISQVKSGWMSAITGRGVKRIQVKQYFMSKEIG